MQGGSRYFLNLLSELTTELTQSIFQVLSCDQLHGGSVDKLEFDACAPELIHSQLRS